MSARVAAQIKWVNEHLLKDALQLVNEDGWDSSGEEGGVQVWRKYVTPDRKFAGLRTGKGAAQFVVVKAQGIIDVPVDQLFELFKDNEKAKEYNEYCKEVTDLEWFDEKTKVTYSETGKPWSRDFVTRVYYHGDDAESGSKVIVSRGEEHVKAPKKKGVTRMEMTIGANVLRPVSTDASRTELTLLTHVNPGGLANTQFGAMVTNRLSAESPRAFIKKLNEVATGKAPTEEPKKSFRQRLVLKNPLRRRGEGDEEGLGGNLVRGLRSGRNPLVLGARGVKGIAVGGVSLLKRGLGFGWQLRPRRAKHDEHGQHGLHGVPDGATRYPSIAS